MLENVKFSSRGQITIPSNIRKAMRLKDGTKAIIAKVGNVIHIYPDMYEDTDIMDLYGSVDPKGESTDPKKAIEEAKRLRAEEIAKNG